MADGAVFPHPVCGAPLGAPLPPPLQHLGAVVGGAGGLWRDRRLGLPDHQTKGTERKLTQNKNPLPRG